MKKFTKITIAAIGIIIAIVIYAAIVTFVPNEMMMALLTSVYVVTTVLLYVNTIENNKETRSQYSRGLNPLLSFYLFEQNKDLVLKITNTGKMPATAITIKIKDLRLGRKEKVVRYEFLFDVPFDLYPNESVQSMITPFTWTYSKSFWRRALT
jgi:hypothetical protein